MANRKIGATIVLDGEKEFKSAVTACNKSLSTMQSAMKLASAQADAEGRSIDSLRNKQNALIGVLNAAMNKQEAVSDGLEHAEKDYKRVGNELNAYKGKLTAAQAELKQMKESGSATSEELKEQEEVVKNLSETVELGEKAYATAGARVETWQKQMYDADTAVERAKQDVNENTSAMKELEQATDGAADELGDFANEADSAADSTDELDVSLGSMLKNAAVNVGVDMLRNMGSAAADAAKFVVESGSAFESSMSKVEALSGATEGQLSKMSAKAKQLGSSTKFSATQVAESFKYMSLAGWDTEQMLSAVDGVVNLDGIPSRCSLQSMAWSTLRRRLKWT